MRRVVVVLAMIADLAAASGRAAETAHPGFTLNVPKGFTVQKVRGPDFDVYTVRKHDRPYVGIYVGFAPSFPTDEREQVRTQGTRKIGALRVNGRMDDREWLIPHGTGYLHVWVSDPGPGDIEVARKIALSVEPD